MSYECLVLYDTLVHGPFSLLCGYERSLILGKSESLVTISPYIPLKHPPEKGLNKFQWLLDDHAP